MGAEAAQVSQLRSKAGAIQRASSGTSLSAPPLFKFNMGNTLKGLGILAAIGIVAGAVMGPSDPPPATGTPQPSTQALPAKPSEQLKQEQARRDKEVSDKLAALDQRVSQLLARPTSSEGWETEALAIAAEFRKFPQSPALSALTSKWRTAPAIVQAYSAELKPLVAAYKAQLPKLLQASREMYRDKADRALLDAGIESRVTIGRGAKGASLRVTSALVGRVFADRLANASGMLQAAESAGFYHLVFVNSIDESYITYDLDPKLDMSTRAIERDVLWKWGMED